MIFRRPVAKDPRFWTATQTKAGGQVESRYEGLVTLLGCDDVTVYKRHPTSFCPVTTSHVNITA
jgi:hypothetical protein